MKRFLVIIYLLLIVPIVLPACKTPVTPAAFELVSLDITPSEVTAGNTSTATVKIKNAGGSDGIYTAILTVNGMEMETRDIAVAPETIETVTFSLVQNEAGIYTVAVGSLHSDLTVQDKKPEFITQKLELKYDDGTRDASYSWVFPVGYGHLVEFSPTIIPFTITEVRLYGRRYGDEPQDKMFELQIWNERIELIYSEMYPHDNFSTSPAWVAIKIPDIVVTDAFYVHLDTNSQKDKSNIGIYFDSSLPNEHSEITKEWNVIEEWPEEWLSLEHPLEKGKTNWMIRVVGTITVPKE